jgi:flagellar basal-body rod protein FlgF
MERYIQISSASMRLQADNQRMIAASLANQNTVAFKRDYSTTASAYFDVEGGTDRVFPSRGEATVDAEIGKMIPTDNPMDVAIEGDGYFTARTASGDSVLTRRGDLRIGADRVLKNGENLTMEEGTGVAITIPPYESIEISKDGSILIRPPGAPMTQPLTVVGRLRMVQTPAGNLEKGGDGVMRLKDKTTPQPDANITLNTRSLESSNVNSIDSMVEMLNASRTFEVHVKLLATAKELDDSTAKLMRNN